MSEAPELPEIAIRLGESDGFRRNQVIAMSDLAAHQAGEIAVLRSQLSKPPEPQPDLTARIAELETTVSEKDEQIVEQSNTIVSLRARLAELEPA